MVIVFSFLLREKNRNTSNDPCRILRLLYITDHELLAFHRSFLRISCFQVVDLKFSRLIPDANIDDLAKFR